MCPIGLIRGTARVGAEGKIALPGNILRAMDLKEKDVVDVKITGSRKAKKLVISSRHNAR